MAERQRRRHQQRIGSGSVSGKQHTPPLTPCSSFRQMDDASLPRAVSAPPPEDDKLAIVTQDGGASAPSSRTARHVARRLWRRSPSELSTSYQPLDWASDDGVCFDGSRLRRFRSAGDAQNASNGGKTMLQSADALDKGDCNDVDRDGIKDTAPATLHGKNLLQLMALGSIESIRQDSSSVDWSDSLGVVDEDDDLSLMDPHFDLTTAKLSKLFGLFNPSEDGNVSYEGFRCGMEAMGIACEDDEQFQAFLDNVDDDKSGGITYQEFLFAIQEIKLAQLFSPEFLRAMPPEYTRVKAGAEPAALGSIEYSPDRIRSVYPIEQVEKFIYSTKPSWATVRWINVEGVDPLLMRRLSVRYRLHPLAVEDALDADVERPKYEQYDEHSSLILQTVHARDLTKVKQYQRMYRASLYSRDDATSAFGSMTKKELEDRLTQLDAGCIMTPPEQLSVYIMEEVLISVQESGRTLWPAIKQRLDMSYSKVRQHSTAFLVYTIVDVCVDELSPIAHTFGAKLAMLERLLRMDPRYFDVNRLARCSKQVKGLKVLCKPLSEVIVQLAASNDYEGETLRYFRDVQDHITTIEEDCERHLDRCRSLVEDFHNARAAEQNDVSYILALVAAIFLPAQFLTGLYGMNFTNMPELTYHNGYYVWWAVVLLIALLTVLFFKFKRWL